MLLALEVIAMCGILWGICLLNTGSDMDNIKGFRNYPKDLREKLKENPKYKDKIRVSNPIVTFISNVIMFTIIELVFGIFLNLEGYLANFVALLILGEAVNIFDVLVLDLWWFRSVKRVRFSDYPEKENYQNMHEHIMSFIKAIFMFAIVAAIDAAFLMLI